MSNNIEETVKETPKQPTTGTQSGELKEEELDKVSGGRPRSLNPQPLPPYAGGF